MRTQASRQAKTFDESTICSPDMPEAAFQDRKRALRDEKCPHNRETSTNSGKEKTPG